MRSLADPERYVIVERLLAGVATQKQLGQELALSSGTVSRRCKELEVAGLVSRERSHGPYRLAFRHQVWQVLQAAADLGRDLTAERARMQAEHASGLRRTGMRGPPPEMREQDA